MNRRTVNFATGNQEDTIGALLSEFLSAARDDARIGTAHISVYASLLAYCRLHGCENPVSVFRHDIMPLCKISGSATYHRSIRQLHDYGYIKYTPSFNHFLGSLVYFIVPEPAGYKI